MSGETQLGQLLLAIPQDSEPSEGELSTQARILETANDRPHTDTLPVLTDPAADHLDPELLKCRADVDQKHQRIIEYLDRSGLDAVLLGRADSIAWFTAGGDLEESMASDRGAILLFINRTSRAVLADNVQSPRVFEEELAGLGFQLKERPWYQDPEATIAALAHGKKVSADLPGLGPQDDWPRLQELRIGLTPLERQRLRELGRTLSLAVEATCRNFHPGETEADVAGHLAHRLLREGVVPVELRVASDDRLERYRQPGFKSAPIHRRAILAVTGRRHGLCASVTRIVSFGPVDPSFRMAHGLATMVDATCIYFSRPGETVGKVFQRARRIYEKFRFPHEWTLDYQGYITGHSPRELPLRPDSTLKIRPDMALRWNPSVKSARSEDTIVVDARGYEVVTEAQRWPKIEVQVKGFSLPMPGILER
ncbi:M24 family metallopeptidase [soil metagenome]